MTTGVLATTWRGAASAHDPTTTPYWYQRVVWPHIVKAGGSRERLNAMQLYGPVVNESKATCEYIALRRFREPPAFIFFGGTSVEANVARVAVYAPKRLPSRRWVVARGMTCRPIEDEDDDEYEDESRFTNVSGRTCLYLIIPVCGASKLRNLGGWLSSNTAFQFFTLGSRR